MYYCEFCNKITESGEQLTLAVTKKRIISDEKTGKVRWEIAETKRCCPRCRKEHAEITA